MGYEREHILLRINGHFGSSASPLDFWSVGLRLATVGGTPPQTSNLVAFLETISSPIQAFHTSVPVGVGSNCYLSELTAAHIGLDGKYASAFAETVRRPYTTPVAGNGTAVNPWNVAHVISLRTQKKRGLASNGRIYYPALATTPAAATGRLTAGVVAGRIDQAKVMFDAINVAAQAASNGLRIYVLSFGSKNPDTGGHGPGWSAVVTDIRGDQRLDTQERRENNQPPVWYQKSINYT